MRAAQSLDHLVGAGEQRQRDRQAERLGGREIDHQLELDRGLNWKLAWFRALENAITIRRRTPVFVDDVRTIRDQAAEFSEGTGPIDGRQTVARSQQSNLCAMADREGIRYHEQAAIRLACLCD